MAAPLPLVTAKPGPLDVLYRDEQLIVVNKPSGLSAHRGLANERDYVLTRVRDMVGQPVYLVHRLDRATSGALALVLDPSLVAPLQRAFQAEQVEKRYLALARGVLPPELELDYPVPRSREHKHERLEARTAFRLLGVYANRYGLVEARPRTGRHHQIRRHLAHLQSPIIGDSNYGDRRENRRFREQFGLLRLALHAYALTLPHPQSGEQLAIVAPLGEDLRGPFAAMGFAVDPTSGLWIE